MVLGLPFLFQRKSSQWGWRDGDPVLVVISPHNEAIRYEFGRAFSRWHAETYGRPAKIDWRVIGGTSEIMRYLAAEYTSSFRSWWEAEGRRWPQGGSAMVLDRRFKADVIPAELHASAAERQTWELKRALHWALRNTDDPSAFTCKIDVLFGGGTYDHNRAAQQGLSVTPRPEA